jgi:hypothetical protein
MFRFTIRDVLWLTVVVAVAVAWWLDHRNAKGIAKKSGGRCPSSCRLMG